MGELGVQRAAHAGEVVGEGGRRREEEHLLARELEVPSGHHPLGALVGVHYEIQNSFSIGGHYTLLSYELGL